VKGVMKMAEAKKATAKVVAKAAPAKAEVKKEDVKAEVKVEAKAPAKKAAAKKTTTAKKETVKKEAPAKKETAAKKAPAKKTVAKKAAVAETVNFQFSGKSYTPDDLLKSCKDVWKYDLGGKEEDLKSIELYVKPEENTTYYVINGDITGSFFI
jgi:hypothetical protein